MKTHRWLHKRNSVYYLRAIVPRYLTGVVGKREITRSLRTSRKAEAMQRIRPLIEDVEQTFERAKQELIKVAISQSGPRTRRGRALRLKAARFPSVHDALAHDLLAARKQWGDPQAFNSTNVPAFYESLKSLAKTFPEARLSDVLAAIEAEQKKREPRIQPTKFVPRIVPSEEKTD